MIELIVFVTLMILGYGFGRLAESRHFKSIREREARLSNVLIFTGRVPPPEPWQNGTLISGNVVISIDYFKRIAGALKALFGGRVTVYESLLERGRREALLRMKEEAARIGSPMVINVRLETASISKGGENQIGSVEVYAYGTALLR